MKSQRRTWEYNKFRKFETESTVCPCGLVEFSTCDQQQHTYKNLAQSSFPPRAHLIWHKFMPLNSVPASQRKPGFHADPASEGWPYKPLEGWTYETHNPKMKGNLWAAYRNL